MMWTQWEFNGPRVRSRFFSKCDLSGNRLVIEVTSPLDLLFLTVANLLLCRRKGYLSLPEYDSSALCLGMKISKMPKVQFNIPGVGVKKKKKMKDS